MSLFLNNHTNSLEKKRDGNTTNKTMNLNRQFYIKKVKT